MIRKRGVISVYLILILVCITSIILGLIESSRIDGSRFFLQQAADSSIDSLFSNYDRAVWEAYNILLLGQNEAGSKKEFDKYLNEYMANSGIYHLRNLNSNIEKKIYISDYGGRYLEKEILDYMKYAAVNMSVENEDICKRIKEAGCIKDISRDYVESSLDISDIESTIVALKSRVDEIGKELNEALEYAENDDIEESLNSIGQADSKIEQAIDNIKQYKRLSAELNKRIEGNKDNKNWDELSEDVREEWKENLNIYNLYKNENLERKTEIESLEKELLDAHTDIDNLEWSESEDEDLPTLYEALSSLHVPDFNMQVTKGDKQKENNLKRIYRFFDREPIKLVIPQGVELSRNKLRKEVVDPNISYEDIDKSNLIDRLLINEYISRFFSEFTDSKNIGINYEMEYLAVGKKEDIDNLNICLLKILAIREGLNLAYIFSDKQMVATANNLASLITGIIGLPSLTGVMTFFIISTWVLIESVIDLRTLLKGGRIPILKEKKDWKSDLDTILDMSNDELDTLETKGEEGFSYEDYLRMFLLSVDREKINYRMINLIQDNLFDKIDIKNMFYGMQIRVECISEKIFSKYIGYFDSGILNQYRLNTSVIKSY